MFDEETTVQDIVKQQIAMGENMANNFTFVKSETEIFVQLSDVVAGILGIIRKNCLMPYDPAIVRGYRSICGTSC